MSNRKLSVQTVPMYGYCDYQHEDTLSMYKLLTRKTTSPLHDVIEKMSKLPVGSVTLNLGCGDGNFELKSGSDRNYQFVSVDIEPAAIKSVSDVFYHQGRTQKDVGVIGNIANLQDIEGVCDTRFDAVILWRVLHGVPVSNHMAIVEQIKNVLKKGGDAYIAVASEKDWKAKALGSNYVKEGVNDCRNVMFDAFGVERTTPFSVHFFSENEIVGLFEDNGFKLVESKLFQDSSGYPHLQHLQNTYVYAHFTIN